MIPPMFVVLVAAAMAPIIGTLTGRIGLSIVVIELALGFAAAIGLGFVATGLADSWLVVTIALVTTALGVLVGLVTRDSPRLHDLHAKVDALGFGFLVPVFFLVSGMKLDVRSIFAGTQGLALLAAFFVALLLVRLPLVVLLQGTLGWRRACATGLLSATTLPLIVVLTHVAVATGVMAAAEAAPLVGAGILGVIVYPLLGLKLAGLAQATPGARDARDGL